MSKPTVATQSFSTPIQNSTLLVIGGSLVLAVLSQVKIPLPFTPVPVTAQTFGVLFLAAALGRKLGVAAVLAYLAEGFVGLPVFAGGVGGMAYVIGPTAGYLVGFIAAAWLVGTLADRGWRSGPIRITLMFLAGHAAVFAFGLGWLSVAMGVQEAFVLGFIPFIPGLILKTIALVGATPLTRQIRSWI